MVGGSAARASVLSWIVMRALLHVDPASPMHNQKRILENSHDIRALVLLRTYLEVGTPPGSPVQQARFYGTSGPFTR